jgi:TRAP transporter TAXI family solute receptor
MGRFVCFATIIGILLFVVSIAIVNCEKEAKVEKQTKITFGTGLPTNEKMNNLSRSVTRAVEKYCPHFDVVFMENTGGTTEVIKNIERYDLCGISLDEAAQAYYGFWAWKGKPHPQLRLLCVMGILPVAFLVAEDTGIKSISKLEGKPYGNGDEASMADFKARKLLEAVGIKPRWKPDSLKTQINLYKNGRLAGFIRSGPDGRHLSDCHERRPFTVLEISESELMKVNQRYKGSGLIFPPAPIRIGTYPGLEKNIVTFGLVIGYYARKDLPLEMAYNFIKSVWQDVWNISASYEPLKLDIIGFPKLTLEYGSFPLHSGAVKFYRELGLKVPNKLLPPEMR